MGQQLKLQDGTIVEQGPDGNYHEVLSNSSGPSFVTKAPNTLDVQGKTLGNQKAGLDVTKGAATLPYDIQKAQSEAKTAALAAQTAQEQWDMAHPAAASAGLTGPALLATLPAGRANMVKALAEGRMAFPSGAAMKSPASQALLAQVAQYDPTFDATNYAARAAARKNAISGKLGASDNALSTAIGHAGLLYDQIPNVASHGFTPLNSIINATKGMFGDPAVTTYNQTATKLGDESMAAYRNGGGTGGEAAQSAGDFNINGSQAQKESALHNALELFASKEAANLNQYNFGNGHQKPPLEMLDPHALAVLQAHAPDVLQKYFAVGPGGQMPTTNPPFGSDRSGNNGGAAPSLASPPPPSAPPGSPPAGASIATNAAYRNEPNPQLAQQIDGMVRAGRPATEINAYIAAATKDYPYGMSPISQDQVTQAQQWVKEHPNDHRLLASATTAVPNSTLTNFAGSPVGAAVNGYVSGATAGLNDEASGAISAALGNGNYRDNVAKFNALKQVQEQQNPGATMAGNIAGGLVGTLGGGAALDAVAPGISAAAQGTRYGRLAGDTAYGALYGAGENNDNRLAGAVEGGAGGAAGGMFARAVGRVVAPAAGAAAELYKNGVIPTIGQRAGIAGGTLGRALNNTEQALGSVPFFGALVRGERQAAKDQFQVGGWNQALAPLDGTGLPSQLPSGTAPGTGAQSFVHDTLSNAYDKARSGMQFVADPQFGQDLGAFQKGLNDGTLNANQVKQVNTAIQSSLDGRINGSSMSGDNYKAAISDLGRKAAAWSGNPETAPMAPALNGFIDNLDSAARRNSDPASVALLDAADKGWAQFARLRDATSSGGVANKAAGTFSPTDLIGAVKRGGGGIKSTAYNEGDALGQGYAEAGRGLIDTLPNSGTPDRLMTAGGLMTLGAPAAIAHNPALLAPLLAYAPGIRAVVNKAVAPNSVRFAPQLAAPLDALGNGIYNNAGMFAGGAAPAALGYFGGQ